MIYLNRLDGKEIVINGLLIESLESSPDTFITLTTGKRIVVRQSVKEVVEKFEDFIRRTHTIINK